MLHIVFQQADVDVLQQAIAMDETMGGEVWEIKDDYAVGPIENIYNEDGKAARLNWWKEVLEFSPYTESINEVDDAATTSNIIAKLEEGETIWIWMGQNQHDVCGYYWLISQLKNYHGQVHVLYLNNLPFINEKGNIFYPCMLHEIQPKEFLKAKKLARLVTLSELEVDPDEWKKLCTDNAMVRTLEGGKKIINNDVSFYDEGLMRALTAEPQKLYKVLNSFFSKAKVKTGDAFLVWRLRDLIAQNKIAAEGDWNKGWKEITLKLAGIESKQEPQLENAE
ncbi:MAG TPA: DUF1835 domain-containing protein [Chitinophagaceae bacterium]|nr:DUF1835 domain-containing protein [Chitinophagaceae bacterium]